MRNMRATRIVAPASSSGRQPVWASGRVDTVLRWMAWLGPRTSRAPAGIAVHRAFTYAVVGQPG